MKNGLYFESEEKAEPQEYWYTWIEIQKKVRSSFVQPRLNVRKKKFQVR